MIKKLTLKKIILSITLLLSAFTVTASGLYLLDAHNEKAMLDYVNHVEVSRYKHPVVDVEKEKVVIPEARISLPMNADTRDIRYQYWAGNKDLWLSMAIAMGRQAEGDDPGCDKIVKVLSTAPSANPNINYTFEGTITANDGTLRYIYRHKPCSFYDDTLSKHLTDIAKNIQYY